jgi:hypothetical protein
MFLAGISGIILIQIYTAVMQREFQNTENKIGKGFSILGIYLFNACFCELNQNKSIQEQTAYTFIIQTV